MKLNKQLKETRMQNGIDISEPKVRQVGNLIDDTDRGFDNPQTGRVYDTNGLCPTINTMQGGDREPKILSYTRDDKGKITNYHVKDEANTIHSSTGGGGNTSQYVIATMRGRNPDTPSDISKKIRIRKLTERECFRLMGVSETDIDKIQHSGVSRSQQYKMAGNSIVVDCLYHIFRKLFIETQCEEEQLKLF